MIPKRARLVAMAIAVCCPHCEAEQPSPDNGSDMWTPEQVKAVAGDEVRVCMSCEQQFVIRHSQKVST